MAENKTKPTEASVDDYVVSRANEQHDADCHELMALFKRVTRQEPKIWGPSIVGYGSYRYTYEEGGPAKHPWLPSPSAAVNWWCTWIVKTTSKSPCCLGLESTGWPSAFCTSNGLPISTKSVLEKLVAGSIAEVRQGHE